MSSSFLSTLKFKYADSNSSYNKRTYYGFPKHYGSMKIAATVDSTGVNMSTNKKFYNKTVSSPKFRNAIIAKQLILVSGGGYCNGSSDSNINVIGGGESPVSVSPNGNYELEYLDCEKARIYGGYYAGTRSKSFSIQSNYDYGNNYLWVPPRTLFFYTIDKNNWSFSDRVYQMYNGSDNYICFHMNRLNSVWSMKVPDQAKSLEVGFNTVNRGLILLVKTRDSNGNTINPTNPKHSKAVYTDFSDMRIISKVRNFDISYFYSNGTIDHSYVATYM